MKKLLCAVPWLALTLLSGCAAAPVNSVPSDLIGVASEATLVCLSEASSGGVVLLPAEQTHVMFFNDTANRLLSISLQGRDTLREALLEPGAARVIALAPGESLHYQIQGLAEGPSWGRLRREEALK